MDCYEMAVAEGRTILVQRMGPTVDGVFPTRVLVSIISWTFNNLPEVKATDKLLTLKEEDIMQRVAVMDVSCFILSEDPYEVKRVHGKLMFHPGMRYIYAIRDESFSFSKGVFATFSYDVPPAHDLVMMMNSLTWAVMDKHREEFGKTSRVTSRKVSCTWSVWSLIQERFGVGTITGTKTNNKKAKLHIMCRPASIDIGNETEFITMTDITHLQELLGITVCVS
jgi:hypothetical protein